MEAGDAYMRQWLGHAYVAPSHIPEPLMNSFQLYLQENKISEILI